MLLSCHHLPLHQLSIRIIRLLPPSQLVAQLLTFHVHRRRPRLLLRLLFDRAVREQSRRLATPVYTLSWCDDAVQCEVFVSTEWAALSHFHYVSPARLFCFVVCEELACFAYVSWDDGMASELGDGDVDGFLHGGGDDGAGEEDLAGVAELGRAEDGGRLGVVHTRSAGRDTGLQLVGEEARHDANKEEWREVEVKANRLAGWRTSAEAVDGVTEERSS